MVSAYLVASVGLTILGIAFFAYGRRVASVVIGTGGIVLLLAPYLVFSAWALWGLAAAVSGVTVYLRVMGSREPQVGRAERAATAGE
jgi:hypothetical protein